LSTTQKKFLHCCVETPKTWLNLDRLTFQEALILQVNTVYEMQKCCHFHLYHQHHFDRPTEPTRTYQFRNREPILTDPHLVAHITCLSYPIAEPVRCRHKKSAEPRLLNFRDYATSHFPRHEKSAVRKILKATSKAEVFTSTCDRRAKKESRVPHRRLIVAEPATK
jgi:hypothetical protein